MNDRPYWLPERKPFGRMKRGNQAFYNSRRARKISAFHKWANPLCSVEGCNEPAYFSDHTKPINEGGDPYSLSNRQSLCIAHNASKTGKQRG